MLVEAIEESQPPQSPVPICGHCDTPLEKVNEELHEPVITWEWDPKKGMYVKKVEYAEDPTTYDSTFTCGNCGCELDNSDDRDPIDFLLHNHEKDKPKP
jgi:hypothetical protein